MRFSLPSLPKLIAATAAVALSQASAADAGRVPTAPAAAVIAPSVDADPALWVVKDDDTTIYLFGTIHVLKPGLTWFDEAVKTAFDASDTLVLEMIAPDQAAMQALVMKTGFTTAGPPLSRKIPEPTRTAYANTLSLLGVPAATFERADPWLAATQLSLIPILKAGYDPANGPEQILTAAAGAADKQMIGLETAEQQLGYFDTLPEPVQMTYLQVPSGTCPKRARRLMRWSPIGPKGIRKRWPNCSTRIWTRRPCWRKRCFMIATPAGRTGSRRA